jgi:hypothetical protein
LRGGSVSHLIAAMAAAMAQARMIMEEVTSRRSLCRPSCQQGSSGLSPVRGVVNVSERSSAVGQRAVLPGKLAQHGNKGQQLSVV